MTLLLVVMILLLIGVVVLLGSIGMELTRIRTAIMAQTAWLQTTDDASEADAEVVAQELAQALRQTFIRNN